jgi:alkaline phosphatase
MKRASVVICMIAIVVMSLSGTCIAQGNGHKYVNTDSAKNVIFMVPDGMGLADVTAARIFSGGVDGASLAFEMLPVIGYQRTHSENSTVTDSAAAASAWACGEKFSNGEICLHSINGHYNISVLEVAASKGKATTHARNGK